MVDDGLRKIAAPININRMIHRMIPDDKQNTPGGHIEERVISITHL
jgi:hypothetical protein